VHARKVRTIATPRSLKIGFPATPPVATLTTTIPVYPAGATFVSPGTVRALESGRVPLQRYGQPQNHQAGRVDEHVQDDAGKHTVGLLVEVTQGQGQKKQGNGVRPMAHVHAGK